MTLRKSNQLILIGILALALVARVRYITEIEHNVDHAYPVWQAMTTLDWGEFPLAGQGTSVLFANPPLTGYLYIPVVALTRSPLGVYVFVILLNWLGVWLTYKATRLILDEKSALVAAALMAVNPWVIEYSRTSWVQALLPFFVPLVAWLLWGVLLNRTRLPAQRMIFALIAMTLLAHTYLLAFFIVVPVGLLMLIFRKRVPWRGVWIGSTCFLLMFSLYVIGLVNQAETVADRVENFSSSEPSFRLEAFQHALRLVTGKDYEVVRGLDAPADDFELRYDLTQPAVVVLSMTIFLGIGAAAWQIVTKREKRDAALIVLIWFGLPVLAMTYTNNIVHPMYQLLGLPAGYVLAAWGIHIVTRTRLMTWVLSLAFIPFAALMLTNSARYYQETNALPGMHEFSALPVDVGMTIGQMVSRALPQDGIVYIPIDAWIINSFSGRLFTAIRDTRAPDFHYVPARGGLYIQMMSDDAPLPYGAQRLETLMLNDGQQVTVDLLPQAQNLDITGISLNIPTQQGLTLLAYDLWQVGTQWRIRTFWRVDAVPQEVLQHIYAPFVHVFNADGERVAIVDGQGLPGYAWSIGDIHVHEMQFDAPDDFTLMVGQFDGLHNVGLIFLPPDGEPVSAVTITPQAELQSP
ncbi:MAG: hypothetical protein CUN56_10100 [Phototrophicales bacterium]|nr:MAG: hypothetical protein CUN56_10100 [Phototrophicales bacterium]RMG77983.1 MAG: hypothetical protein D6711_00290 [Chloroflexota bacterium]